MGFQLLLRYSICIMFYYLIIVLISIGAAFFSGLLGIGGGIILIPSYLYLLPLLGFDHFSVNVITGVAATQAMAAGFFAFKNHSKFEVVNKSIAYKVALFAIPGAFAGTIVSSYLSSKQLLFVYLVILTFAGLSVLIPETLVSEENPSYRLKNPILVNFIILVSTAISSAMGFGGAVNFIPILNHFYKMPIKSTISTVTYLIVITTLVTFLGKMFLGLVPFNLIPLIVAGSALGAWIGAKISRGLSPLTLKIILFIVVLTIWIRIFITYIS